MTTDTKHSVNNEHNEHGEHGEEEPLNIMEKIGSLEEEKKEAYRRPTVFELAHLTAVLNGQTHASNDAKFAVDDALKLWQLCGETLRKAIHSESCSIGRKWVLEGTENQDRKPRTSFEKELLSLFGKKIRRAERYKILRRFLCSEWIEKKAMIQKEADDWIANNKRNGLGWRERGFLASKFPGWFQWLKTSQAKKKAARAANKRWGKKV